MRSPMNTVKTHHPRKASCVVCEKLPSQCQPMKPREDPSAIQEGADQHQMTQPHRAAESQRN